MFLAFIWRSSHLLGYFQTPTLRLGSNLGSVTASHSHNEIAQKYLALALSKATFDDIVSAYGTSSLASLMCAHGINISELENQGIRLRSPPPCEYSSYRLMIGVEHALSGRFCSCFSVRESRDCHTYYETHIDRESDANFGVRLTNSWERWQLLNFYQHFFRLPSFDPHLMAEATKDPDLGSLENYLDSLVPDMRRKIWDRNRINILFPRLKDRLRGEDQAGRSIVHYHLPCLCKEQCFETPKDLLSTSLNHLQGVRSLISSIQSKAIRPQLEISPLSLRFCYKSH
jgi:hypothetical protein